MRRAKKRDANEPAIVAAFEARGCTVTRIDAKGVPDLLVGWRGANLLVEVKMPLGPRGGMHTGGNHVRGDLTADQVAWFDAWRGDAVHIVRTVEDVAELLELP